MGSILARMYISIYNMLFNPSNLIQIFIQFNAHISHVLNEEFFQTIYTLLQTVGVGLLAVSFLITMLDKVSAGDFTIQVLFRHILKYVIPYMILVNLMYIFTTLLQLTTAIFLSLNNTLTEELKISASTKVEQVYLAGGLTTYVSIGTKIGYFMMGILPYAISVIFTIVVYFFSVSRLFEITIRIICAPVAVGGAFFGPPGNNDMVRYVKRTMGVFFQIVVILVVWSSLSFVHNSIISSTSEPVPNPADKLEQRVAVEEVKMADGYYYMVYDGFVDENSKHDAPLTSAYVDEASPAYTRESIKEFIQACVNPEHYFVNVGTMLAALLMLFKSKIISISLFE